jgi:magnesium transporter
MYLGTVNLLEGINMITHRFDKSEKGIMEALVWGDLTWVNIKKPIKTEEVKEYLAQKYPFHELDLDDSLNRIQQLNINEYVDQLLLVLHFPVWDKQSRITEISQVSVFIGDHYLITIHEGRLEPLVMLYRECRDDEERRQKNFSEGAAYLLYQIINRLVDYCFPILNKVGENIDSVEETIYFDRNRTTVREISGLRRDITSLRRIIGPMRTIISDLVPKIRRYSQTDLAVNFGDTINHLNKMWDVLEMHKEVIEGLNSAYDSFSSKRITDSMRILTVLAAMGTTLTVVASFFGMNPSLPGENPVNYAFSWGLLLLWLGIMAGNLLYFSRKGWL